MWQEGHLRGLPCDSDGGSSGPGSLGTSLFKPGMLCHCLRSLGFLGDVISASDQQIHFSSCLWETESGLKTCACVRMCVCVCV